MSEAIPPYKLSIFAHLISDVINQIDDGIRSEALQNAMDITAPGAMQSLLADLRGGQKLVQTGPSIAITGYGIDRSILKDLPEPVKAFCMLVAGTRTEIAQSLKVPCPTIIVKLCKGRSPFHLVGGMDGFGLLCLGMDNLQDKDLVAALRHEITHAILLTGNLFVDEGLATLMEHGFDVDFREQIDQACTVDIRACLGCDWSEDVFFSALKFETLTSPHIFAASFIQSVLQITGMDGSDFIGLMRYHKSDLQSPLAYHVFKNVLGIDFLEFANDVPDLPEAKRETVLHQASTAFALGDVDLAFSIQPILRGLVASNQSRDVSEKLAVEFAAYAKTSLCLALSQVKDSHIFKAEAAYAIDQVKEHAIESPDAVLLTAYNTLLSGQNAKSPIDRNAANYAAAVQFSEALSTFPENVEIVLAVAKTQTYLPDRSLVNEGNWKDHLSPFVSHPRFGDLIRKLSSHLILEKEAAHHAS